jgi:hypothetical protein
MRTPEIRSSEERDEEEWNGENVMLLQS